MTNSSILPKLESGVFKIVVRNDKVYVQDREYDTQHTYLVGFKKISLAIQEGRVNGEIECDREPTIEFQDEVLSIFCSDHPAVSKSYAEELEASSTMLRGFTKPLSMRISEEVEYFITVNDKYTYCAFNIALNIVGEDTVVNMVTYPLKILWIYLPKAYVELLKKGEVVEVLIKKA